MSPKEVKLTPEQREKLIRNIWLLHDGRWLLKSAEEFGFDAATRLNLAVFKSIAKTEMKQLLAETGYGEVKNIEDLKILLEFINALYTPEEHKLEFKIVDNNTMVLYIRECYLYKMVSKAGNTGIHQCSSRLRCDSWLKAVPLDGEVVREKDTNTCHGTCEIVFMIKWRQKNSGLKKEIEKCIQA